MDGMAWNGIAIAKCRPVTLGCGGSPCRPFTFLFFTPSPFGFGLYLKLFSWQKKRNISETLVGLSRWSFGLFFKFNGESEMEEGRKAKNSPR